MLVLFGAGSIPLPGDLPAKVTPTCLFITGLAASHDSGMKMGSGLPCRSLPASRSQEGTGNGIGLPLPYGGSAGVGEASAVGVAKAFAQANHRQGGRQQA